MKKHLFYLLLLSLCVIPTKIQATTYSIEPENSQITFQVNYMGLIGLIGKFDSYSGKLEWDEDSKTLTKIEGKVDARSVNTSSKDFNKIAADPSVLNSEKNKSLVLQTLSIEKKNNQFFINGILHFHGISNQVMVPVRIVKSGHRKNPKEDYVVFVSKFDINVKRWKVNLDESIYSPTVNVTIQGKATHRSLFFF